MMCGALDRACMLSDRTWGMCTVSAGSGEPLISMKLLAARTRDAHLFVHAM